MPQGLSNLRVPRLGWRDLDPALQRIGDVGLAGCLVLVPLLLGGRHDAARLVYACCVTAAAVGVFGRLAVRDERPALPRWLVAVLAGALLLVGLQAAPTPGWLRSWGPNVGVALLPLWAQGSALGEWRTLSLNPAETRESLSLLAANALLLATFVARLRSVDDVRSLVRAVGLCSAGLVGVALLQFAGGSDKLLGVYDHPFTDFGRTLKGSFTNKNHFAHCVLLGLGPVAWLALRRRADSRSRRRRSRSKERLALTSAVAVMVTAVFVSQSRGAVAAMGVASLLALAACYRAGALRLAQVGGLAAVVLGGFAGVTMFGYEGVAQRMDDLVTLRVDQLDAQHARRLIWQANLDALRASPWFGFGVGSHAEVYPLFLSEPVTREFTHAESGYVQIASETGAAGLTLLVAMLAGVATACVKGLLRERDPNGALLWAAIVFGLAASASHAVVDFVWYAPGLLAPTLALVACAIRLETLTRDGERAIPQEIPRSQHTHAWAGVAAALGCFAVIGLVRPAMASADWDRYLRASVGARTLVDRGLTINDGVSDKQRADAIAASTDRMIELLQRVVATNPNDARAHMRLARRLLQLDALKVASGEYALSLDLVADAARNGGFGNHRQMLAWFDRAFGDRAGSLKLAYLHARTAVRLSPLLGEAYLSAGSLAFLDARAPAQSAYVDQALAVRPYDGGVLCDAGQARWGEGRPEEAIELWRECMRRPGAHRYKIATIFSGFAPAQVVLEQLEPNCEATAVVLKVYSRAGRPEDLGAICDHAAQQARNEEDSTGVKPETLAETWRSISATLRLIDRESEAVVAAEKGVELAPYWFPARLEMAAAYRSVERYLDADPHLRWCLARRPDISYLHDWLDDGAKRRTQVDRNRRARVAMATGRPASPDTPEPQRPPEGEAPIR